MRQHRPRILRIARVRQRRLAAWVERQAGDDWHRRVPSWGASLLIHLALLLLLGLYLYVRSDGERGPEIQARFASQLTEDLTSLASSDHAGDPFTAVKTEEPPSLSIEPATESDRTSQPEIAGLARFTPDLAGPGLSREMSPALVADPSRLAPRFMPDASARGLNTRVTRSHSEDMTAPFSGRDAATRAKLVRREGGTVKSEKAVEDGLHWIVRHQRADGGWSLNFQHQCQGDGRCRSQPVGDSDTAATGLALLPLLGAGHIHSEKSRYQGNVRQGLAWLVEHQSESGDLTVGETGMAHMYSHAIGSMALCEAYGLSRDPGLRASAQRAIDFIGRSQNAESGGWRYVPGQAGDTSVFGWQMFALRSARLSGLRVPRNVLKGCRTYLDSAAADARKVTYAYTAGGPATPVMTAEALLSRQYLGWSREHPPLVKGASMVAGHLNRSSERNIYYWYYATQLLHNMQNKDWERWNVQVRDGLVAMQVGGDGCDRGSWDPLTPQRDRWAANAGGRLFLTSLSVLTLEVYYRYLPLYQTPDRDRLPDGSDDAPAVEKRGADRQG